MQKQEKMRNNILIRILRTTISDIIVVLLFLLIIIGNVIFFEQDNLNALFSKIRFLSINKSDVEVEEVKIELNEEEKKLTHYPYYGDQYGTVKIESIGVDLPLFYGDSLDILKNGIGHTPESYFPGEGGSILCMGHNYKTMLRNFSELEIGDIINVTTEYGEFNYRIYDMRILNETDTDQAPIQKEKEIFMIYTCYPFNNIGYATQRYMVYAELIKE